jgi:uncharacterized SAM-binding protein YcdF (DUF218 family)
MIVARAALGWLLFGILVIWAGTVGLITGAGARPALRNADAIIVMGAAQYNGRPSPVLHARIDRAISLYRLKRAPHLIVTGGVGRRDSLSEGEVARRYAVKQGVPDSVIMVERTGATSAESMAAAALLMRKAHLHSALLVSDSYHMLRLELLARRVGIQGYRAALPTPFKKQWRYVLRESFVFPATALVGGR